MERYGTEPYRSGVDEWFEGRPERMPLERLVYRAGQALGRHYQQTVAAHGLSWTSWRVLGVLAGAEALSHRELAGRVGVTPGTLTPVVDALAGTGHLVRERDRVDRRVVRLSITPRGRDRLDGAAGAVTNAWRERIPQPEPGAAELLRDYLLAVLAAVEDGPRR
jgi:DNA-binding MarR family transcriptional regulator